MPALNTLHDLYVKQLRDLYSAETQLLDALPRMAAAASDSTLRTGLERHLDQTRVQAQRLDSLFMDLDCTPGGHTCQAMRGLLAEADELLRRDAPPAVRDAGLIACAQRVEHYEISAYGTAAKLADTLRLPHHAERLRLSEREEQAADLSLSAAATPINRAALGPATAALR
ncbi:ferritin-like domain-containing protein [Deinococcus arcticus]|uniref:Ferritin-like domain-containing protein n=1 Tax=Deinococcus arcticus TaxID=2136176 RepID=A0A2T3WCK5_9DEIO|nr:ferritin-like domain-containing protein [Deinococcus arcticus]PTA69645.1 ferritin-like domain-containing protein [Deinococcus arcticus]